MLRTGPASGNDASSSLPALAGGSDERQRSGDLRLPWVHVLLGANSQGTLGGDLQDTQCEPETVHWSRLRLVSPPSTPSRGGSAQGAHKTHPRLLQLLGCPRRLHESSASRRRGEAVLVQMALPSEPWPASHVGAVHGLASRLSAPDAPDYASDLGFVATSLIHGGAGWWQSPRPDLERAGVDDCPGPLDGWVRARGPSRVSW